MSKNTVTHSSEIDVGSQLACCRNYQENNVAFAEQDGQKKTFPSETELLFGYAAQAVTYPSSSISFIKSLLPV